MGSLKKIGVLGGTFDPPHLGHLKLATHFAKLFELDALLLIPSGHPWQKENVITSASVRLRLTEAAAIDLARAFLYLQIPTRVGIDQIEVDRPGPSYAIDTAKELRQRFGAQANLIWLMGADAFTNLPTWKHWQGLLSLMNFAVASRPEHSLHTELPPALAELLAQHQCQSASELENHACGEIFIDETLAVDVSSTALREQLQNPSSYDLATASIPSHALEIITNLGLYR